MEETLKVQSSLAVEQICITPYTITVDVILSYPQSLLSDDITMTSLWQPDLVLPITLISSADPKSSERGHSFMECNYVHSMLPVSVPFSAGHLTILKGRPWGTS